MARIRYNATFLDEILRRDNASQPLFTGSPMRDTKVTFTCVCGQEDTKTFRYMNVNGAACQSCTKSAAMNHRQETIKAKVEKQQQDVADPDEIWKDVPVAEGKYEISNCGRLRHKATLNVLKWRGDEDQYLRLTLTIFAASREVHAHILVANFFVENPCPDEYDRIDHIDGDRNNPHFKNLRWCNATLNALYAHQRLGKSFFKQNKIRQEQYKETIMMSKL